MLAKGGTVERRNHPVAFRQGVRGTPPRAERTLDQDVALLAKAEKVALTGSWRYDVVTSRAWWSDAMYRIFGVDPADAPRDLVAALIDAVHPDDRERMRTVVELAVARGAARSSQYRVLMPDKTVRWVAGHTEQESDARGAVTAIVGTVQDITDLKLAAEALVCDAALDRAIASLSAALVTAAPSIECLSDLVLGGVKEFTHSPVGIIWRQSAAEGSGGAARNDAPALEAGRASELGTTARCDHPWGWSSKAGEAFYTNSPEADRSLAQTAAGPVVINCFLTAPAIAGKRLVGHVAVANAPSGYTDADLKIAKRLASFYAIALTGQEERVALVESNRRFERMVYAVSEAMGRVVELRDPYTQGHEVRVARLAKQIAQKMHLSADDIEGIEMASLVHDIGKLCVPVSILSKPGRLSDLEFAMIKEHSLAGYSVLKNIDLPWPVADIVLAHHERCDGSGYPYGLVAADIPQGALIVAVADVVEAMASHRPYRPALGIDAAVAEIANHPAKYDAEVVRAFMALYASGRIDFEEPSRETAVSLSAESPSGEGASAVLDVDRHHRGSSVEARHCSGARSSS